MNMQSLLSNDTSNDNMATALLHSVENESAHFVGDA